MSIYSYYEFKKALADGRETATDEKLLRTFCHKDFLQYFKQRNKELEPAKLYRYMITYTLPADHKFDEDEVEHYIHKQVHRKPLRIVEAHVAKEHTKQGVAHWHLIIASPIPLKKDRFDYFQKLYGIVLYKKTKAQNLVDGLNYINKETRSIQLI